MRITQVTHFELAGSCSDPVLTDNYRQVQPLDLYPEFAAPDPPPPPPAGGVRTIKAIYCQINTDEGVSGIYGPIFEAQAHLIAMILRPFLLGRDPLATELLSDQMLRLHRHGRSGLLVTAISAVDCCLWDLKGKAMGQPVYRLLGGPTRPVVPAYASMLGFCTEPERAGQIARQYQELGYAAQKWFFRFGPGHGPDGMRRNLELARVLREAVGGEYPLMFDAYMGWDLPYAMEMARQLAELRPRWLEEPLPPERVGGLRRLCRAGHVPIATGEHVYTRWQVKELLERGAVDVVQTDPDWTGGITEQCKICDLCSAFDVQVVAHGHALLPALHFAASRSPATVPWVEYLFQHQENMQFFHSPIYRPQNGQIALPELPGLGLVIDEAKVRERRALP